MEVHCSNCKFYVCIILNLCIVKNFSIEYMPPVNMGANILKS